MEVKSEQSPRLEIFCELKQLDEGRSETSREGRDTSKTWRHAGERF